MRCPVCHSFLSPDDKFCSYCGEKIVNHAEHRDNVIVLPGRERTVPMAEAAARAAEPGADGASSSGQKQRRSGLALGCFAFVALLVCSFLLFPNWAGLVMKPVSSEEVSVNTVYHPFGKSGLRDSADPGLVSLDAAVGDAADSAELNSAELNSAEQDSAEQDKTTKPRTEDETAAESVAAADETAAANEEQRRTQTASGSAQTQQGKSTASAQVPPPGNTVAPKDTQTTTVQDADATAATPQAPAAAFTPTAKEPEAAAPTPEYTITATPMSGTLQVGQEMSFYVTHNFPGAKVYLGQDNFGPELGTYSQYFSWNNLSASFTIKGRSSGPVQIYFFYEDGAGHFIKTPQISINIVDAEYD